FDNYLEKSPLALRVVPLPEFTIDRIPQKNVEQNHRLKIALNIFLFLFIPRWYKISRDKKKLLSPFSRVVRYENNDDMYDNPATEAVIDFPSYLLVTELIQLYFHGPRKYFGDIFNSFDISSILLPMIVMSIMLQDFKYSDGFASVESVDMGLMVGTSFSIFFLWIEFVNFISPSNIKFVLLKNPNNPQINLKSDTLSGTAENLNNETLFNIKLVSDYDVQDKNDNPFSSFSTAIMAAYFWLNGDLIQRDHFDFWVIDLFTLIAIYERAETKGRQALLRFRANQIADYEALEHFHFWPPETEPKYIYYVGRSKNFQEWYEKKKDDQGEIYKDFEEKSTINNQAFIDVDYNDVSIWKFDDNNSSNTKGKKREDSTDSSRLSKIVEENNNTPAVHLRNADYMEWMFLSYSIRKECFDQDQDYSSKIPNLEHLDLKSSANLVNFGKNLKKNLTFFSFKDDTNNMLSAEKDILFKSEQYQIAICQNGKFAVTFDTENLRIRVLENTDHRQFKLSEEKTNSEHNSNNQNDEEITKTITYFKIKENLEIDKLYNIFPNRKNNSNVDGNIDGDTDDRYKWSLDISNVQNYQDKKYSIFIAVSRIDVNEDMKGKGTKSDYKKNTIKKRFPNSDVRVDLSGNETKKGTAVYRLKLKKDDNNNFDLESK
ncbi:17515_t:CDS:10, partial [Rhizophagus irregularis]